jgi:hypothetical protein
LYRYRNEIRSGQPQIIVIEDYCLLGYNAV